MMIRNFFRETKVLGSLVMVGVMLFFQNCTPMESSSSEAERKPQSIEVPPITSDTEAEPTPQNIEISEDPTNTSSFSIDKTVSGTNQALNLSFKIHFEDQHLNKNGTIFVMSHLADGRWFAKCWRGWFEYKETDQDAPVETAFIGGILKTFEGSILDAMDVTPFIGAKIYVGYGIGDDIEKSWEELKKSARYKLVYTVE